MITNQLKVFKEWSNAYSEYKKSIFDTNDSTFTNEKKFWAALKSDLLRNPDLSRRDVKMCQCVSGQSYFLGNAEGLTMGLFVGFTVSMGSLLAIKGLKNAFSIIINPALRNKKNYALISTQVGLSSLILKVAYEAFDINSRTDLRKLSEFHMLLNDEEIPLKFNEPALPTSW